MESALHHSLLVPGTTHNKSVNPSRLGCLMPWLPKHITRHNTCLAGIDQWAHDDHCVSLWKTTIGRRPGMSHPLAKPVHEGKAHLTPFPRPGLTNASACRSGSLHSRPAHFKLPFAVRAPLPPRQAETSSHGAVHVIHSIHKLCQVVIQIIHLDQLQPESAKQPKMRLAFSNRACKNSTQQSLSECDCTASLAFRYERKLGSGDPVSRMMAWVIEGAVRGVRAHQGFCLSARFAPVPDSDAYRTRKAGD